MFLRWVERILSWLTALAALALAVMVVLVVVDVVRANVFHRPIIGVVDSVQALLAFIVFLGLPQIIFIEGNITVDVIDHFIGKRGIALLRATGGLCAFVYLGLLWWHMFAPAMDTWRFGDITPDLKIPVILIWVPVLLGMAASMIAALIVFIRDLLKPREADKPR